MTSSNASQEFVPIKEVRDGVMILKDGSIRAVVLATSINFALKSSEEQESVIYQFQNFLNSLDFSLQIYVQSRRLDIRPYLALLDERLRAQSSDLMRMQITEYINFVRGLTEISSIMTKSFFVVIPYAPVNKSVSGIADMFNSKKDKTLEKEKDDQFEEVRSQIEQRVGVVEQGLARCGVKIARLGSEELVELFYRIFNPGDAEKPIKM
ncbi:MAG: TraC family protein [Patescibacteria group bacterium]